MSSTSPSLMSTDSSEFRRLLTAVVGSVVVHLLIVAWLMEGGAHWPMPSSPPVLNVSMVTLPEPKSTSVSMKSPRQQIVAEPASPQLPPPPDTQRLAEYDHRADKEQVARGLGSASVAAPGPERAVVSPGSRNARTTSQVQSRSGESQSGERSDNRPPAPPKPSASERRDQQPRPKAEAPVKQAMVGSLRLDPREVLSRFGGAETAGRPSNTGKSSDGRGNGEGRSNNDRLDAALSLAGGAGTADKLSGLPDGSVTMLNAKANKFAVFVRRVAYRVFAKLRETGWESLAAGHIRAIGRPVVIIAELSPDGTFLKASVQQGSGSPRFDELVYAAIQRSVGDPNPPAGAAAADGRIRFIFQSQSSVSIAPAGPQGAPAERRWIELGTGLD